LKFIAIDLFHTPASFGSLKPQLRVVKKLSVLVALLMPATGRGGRRKEGLNSLTSPFLTDILKTG
jgi:hypothetical protein